MTTMQERAKKGFQRFSVGTSFHGFSELYYARSLFWVIVWIVILLGAFGVTTYQVYSAVGQFLSEPTNTVILPAEEDQILYPPLRMCYMQWLFWVDWKKAMSTFNITKEALLFSLSYFNLIYYSEPFNLTNAHDSLQRVMNDNNFETIFQFYKAIARDVPMKASENNLTSYFDKIEIIYKDPGFLFCYTVSEQQMYKFFKQNRYLFDTSTNGKSIMFTVFDETYPKIAEYVKLQEYNRYSLRWVDVKSMYKVQSQFINESFSDFAPPILIFPNAYNKKSVDIFTENDLYTISLQASARAAKKRAKYFCAEGDPSTATNDTCETRCKAAMLSATCSCSSLDMSVIMNNDHPDTLCQKGIIFINTPVGDRTASWDGKTYSHQVCSDNDEASLSYTKCMERCVRPCTIWTYDTSVSITKMSSVVRNIGKKNSTNISIEYPMGVRIIIMTEVDAQTWESFIGSVGGLLGIWTGASIVSFIQLFYLCCFADNDNIKLGLLLGSCFKYNPFKKRDAVEEMKETV